MIKLTTGMIKHLKIRISVGCLWMGRIAMVICLVFFAGCIPQPDGNDLNPGPEAEIENGGIVENTDREKAEAYFIALGKVQSVDEEEELLTEFSKWLTKNGYKISVVEKNGKHKLACPYFPPVTPWTEHTFFNIKNLDLLPRPENGG